jgi:hypothetical protein
MKFKDDVIAARFDDMCDLAKKVAREMDEWSQKNYGIELTITATVSTLAEDKILGRVSDTHRTRRAFDIRTNDLPEAMIAELCAEFRKKYGKYGAVASAIPSLIVYKPHGTGPHLHVQLSRKYTLKEINYGTP